MEKEIWKDIQGFEGSYQVSDKGRVRGLDRFIVRRDWVKCFVKGEEFKLHNNTAGYPYVGLRKNYKKKVITVHRLVALAFLENKENKSTVNHIDGNKENNNVSNLEWATPSENIIHAHKTGLFPKGFSTGENSGVSKLKNEDVMEIRRLFESGVSRKELTQTFSVSDSTIAKIVTGKSWIHLI